MSGEEDVNHVENTHKNSEGFSAVEAEEVDQLDESTARHSSEQSTVKGKGWVPWSAEEDALLTQLHGRGMS
jgi:hypothetical protein